VPIEQRRGDDPPAELWLRGDAAEAAVAPSRGFWVTAFRVRRGDGWLPILAEPADWSAFGARARFFGNPILFPFPLHVVDGRFEHGGRVHQLRLVDGRQPSHGIVKENPWQLERAWEDDAGLHARASISNTEPADLRADFPFPFRFTTTYSLHGARLSWEMEATNVGTESMPFGVGIHPYMPLPFVAGGASEDLVVTADGAEVARFGPREQSVALEPVPAEADLRGSRRLGDLFGINHAGNQSSIYVTYTDLDRPGFGWRLQEHAAGVTVAVRTSDDFRTMVHWSPADRSVISPVIATSLANGFNLRADGYPSGVRDLEPGQTWRGWASVAVTPAEPRR
jgi:aldose 1-epimerase